MVLQSGGELLLAAQKLHGYEIFLRHSSSVFMQRRGCDSGDIFAYGVRIEENCYTSQLSILISDPSMNNNSVKCLFTNGTSIAVGLSYIEITKGKHNNNTMMMRNTKNLSVIMLECVVKVLAN